MKIHLNTNRLYQMATRFNQGVVRFSRRVTGFSKGVHRFSLRVDGFDQQTNREHTMLDTLLEIGSYADWVTPLWSMIQDRLNEGGHTFLIPTESCYCAPIEIQWFLREKGIKAYGLDVFQGHVMISCHPNQAKWAQYWLDRAGLWIEYGRV